MLYNLLHFSFNSGSERHFPAHYFGQQKQKICVRLDCAWILTGNVLYWYIENIWKQKLCWRRFERSDFAKRNRFARCTKNVFLCKIAAWSLHEPNVPERLLSDLIKMTMHAMGFSRGSAAIEGVWTLGHSGMGLKWIFIHNLGFFGWIAGYRDEVLCKQRKNDP